MPNINTPLQIKQLILKNRVVMSPMCQYSAVNGYLTEWHFVHYCTRAVGGVGAIIQEATAVLPEGRITYGDLGIWENEQITDLSRIASFLTNRGVVPGIQLGHAGRKASCDLPWNGGAQLNHGNINSWQTYAPSAISYDENDEPPVELTTEEITNIVTAFKDAAIRSIEAGYQIIEIHAAHGYLIHQFLSPLSNQRTDEYGGTFENRIRLLSEIVDSISSLMDDNHSLWVRISATDWVEGGWNIEESVKLSAILKDKGVDLIDVSSGGLVPDARIKVSPGYQVPFAERIKNETSVLTGAVGLITESEQINEILESEKCDLVLLGRKLLKDPYFMLDMLNHQDEMCSIPVQYERAY